jgi:hypothetical protein
MKTRLLALISALTLSASALIGQVTYSNATLSQGVIAPSSMVAAQTFTGFDSISAISWNLFQPLAGTTDFNIYVAEWDTVNSRAVSGTVVQFGPSALALDENDVSANFSDTWNTSSPELTYVLLLTAFNSSGFPFGVNSSVDLPADPFFGSGQGFSVAGAFDGLNQAAFDTLVSTSTFSPIGGGADFNFSVTGTLAPVPEPKTAATGLAALFVAALMCRRQVWQKRRASLAA